MYAVGITFHSCGCTGPGYIPNSSDQLKAYLEYIKASYLKNLEFWRNRIEPTTKKEMEKGMYKNWSELRNVSDHYKKKMVKNQEGIDYWINKVKEVEFNIEKIK